MNRPTLIAWSGIAVMVALAFVAVGLVAARGAVAQGYPGAQAEAQTDGGLDPYTFPRVKLCCERRGGGGGSTGIKTLPKPPTGPIVSVNCGAPSSPESAGSLREALSRVTPGGAIYVASGVACDISGLIIDRPVTISSTGGGYGPRPLLTGTGSCANIGTATLQEPVRFSGVDIEGCLALNSGSLELVRDNVSWRGTGAAIEMRGGALHIDQSTVRARETVLNATAGSLVVVEGDSRLATTQDGRYVVRLSVDKATFSHVLLKGARVGIYVENVNSSFSISEFEIVRLQEDDPYPASDAGDQGIVIGDAHALHDLPWLSGMETRTSSIRGGKIAGYRTGVFLGTSTKASVENVSIFGSVVGVHVGAGAFANINGNSVLGNAYGQKPETGIKLEPGARGSANSNHIGCRDDGCVCYGSECSNRHDHVFGGGSFRATNTECGE